MIFSDIIKKIIKNKNGITQENAAASIGIKRVGFNRKLSNNTFYIDEAIDLCDFLEMDLIIKDRTTNEFYILQKSTDK